MDRAGSFLARYTKCLAHDRGDCGRADDLAGHFGKGRHARDDVHDLKPGLFAGQNPFLAGNQNHWHGAKKGVRSAGRKVQSSRPESADANTRMAGQPAIGSGHERRCLLVTRNNKVDFRVP